MELNREQIIKALECCIETQCKNCCNLGNWHEQWNCMTDIMRKALSLINELTERNEQLRGVKEEYENFIGGLKPKIDETTRKASRLLTSSSRNEKV